MNTKSLKLFLICIFALLIFAGAYSLEKKEVDLKIGNENPRLTFQPNARILNNAINPKLLAASAVGISIRPTAKYAYEKDTCLGETSDCYQAYYKNLTKKQGVDVAFEDIKKRYNENPSVATNCHPLMHIIGEEAADYYKTVSEAYLHGDSFCWSGYYHGIMEGVVAKIGIEQLPAKLNSICADIPGKASYNFDYFNCVHGLGHGIMESLADEVPKSLAMCDNLSGNWEKESCYGGVFMENIIANNKGTPSKYLKKEEPLYPCNAIDAKYKFQCYLGQTSYALEVNRFDFKKIFELCATVEDPFRDICNQSMGRDAANQAMHNAEVTKNTCALGISAKDKENCVIGAVKEIISYYHSKTEALEFCSILSKSEESICIQTADAYYRLF